MPKRSEKRDTAKAQYISLMISDGKVNLNELAQSLAVPYQTLRNWKKADSWEDALPKKKRGGQPGNRNSAGKKNAAGHHEGAPKGNKNAEKDGAYSTVFFDMLTEKDREFIEKTPTDSKESLINELQILKYREHRILEKIEQYEKAPENELYVSSLLDMRKPAGRGNKKQDGTSQTMGMYSKDSPFARILKLQEALYKVQGRIAAITNSLRAMEENQQRMELEKQRLEIMKMRATGEIKIDDPEEN